jgi:hypothetical protein
MAESQHWLGGRNSDSRDGEMGYLKKIIGDQRLVIDTFKKRPQGRLRWWFLLILKIRFLSGRTPEYPESRCPDIITDPGRGTFRGLTLQQGKGSRALHQKGKLRLWESMGFTEESRYNDEPEDCQEGIQGQ